MTIKEVAAELNVSQRFVYRQVALGSIEAFKFGKAIRISKEALERYKEGQRIEAARHEAKPPLRHTNLKFLRLRR